MSIILCVLLLSLSIFDLQMNENNDLLYIITSMKMQHKTIKIINNINILHFLIKHKSNHNTKQ